MGFVEGVAAALLLAVALFLVFLFCALNMKLALGGTSGSSAISTINPLYGPGLPIGGDYGTILAYFVNRGRPTYGFSGMHPSMAVVGVEAFNVDFVAVVPVVYLFLDQSMAAESWYYVYRYLYGTALDKFSPPANTGPVSGSPGPLTLISSNVMLLQPNNSYFSPVVLPKSSGAWPLGKGKTSLETVGNPMLVQISLGNAPIVDTSSAW